MNRLKKWLHRRYKVHYYTIPISLEEKQNYYIEGKGSRKSQRSTSFYTKKRCEFCNKRCLIYEKTVITTSGRGTDWM